MSYVIGLIASVLRIVFLRGSPERIYYTRRLFIVSLLLALAASAAAQFLFFADHLVFVILRVFAELTMFMLMMVFLTAKIVRFRLARMMLAMVLISLLADVLLVLMSPLSLYLDTRYVPYVAYVVGGLAIYGASTCVAWGLQTRLLLGASYVALYVAATLGLNLAFRGLFDVMAAS